MDEKNYVVDGFNYNDEALYKDAIKEQKAVDYLTKQLSGANEKQIMGLYSKLCEEKFFKSENGITFLYLLRENLINVYKVEPNNIPVIPVTHPGENHLKAITYDCNEKVKAAKTETKTYKDRCRILYVVVVILAIAIGAMFFILRTSDLPTILDYKEKIENKYSQWEDDLQQRERNLKKRELELNKSNNN